jgi:predicted dienelactone hydrolase
MSAIFLRSNSVMNFVFLVILALSALRSGDADGCTSPYDEGPYTVEILHLSVPITKSVRFILIAVPTVEGKFPVVQFQHGFDVRNDCYSQLISHVASYGFIVVAPQVNSFASFGVQENL